MPRLWIGKCNMEMMSVLPKLICRFNAILIKIPAEFFEDMDNLILKFILKGKGTRIAKTILKKKSGIY